MKTNLLRPHRTLLLYGLALCAAAAGCSEPQLDGTYGKRRGAAGGASVNGTSVLAEMFRHADHKITTKRFLAPGINAHDVIVWAPDDFGMPADAVVSFLEDWLAEGEERQLIYIGRDYDAQIEYWERFVSTAPPEQAVEVLRRLAQARAAHARRRAGMPQDESGSWFKARRDAEKMSFGGGRGTAGASESKPSEPASIAERPEGEPVAPAPMAARWRGTWSRDGQIDASRLAAELHGRLEPPPSETPSKTPDEVNPDYEHEILLASDDDILAYRLTRDDWLGGQIVVVANGSFLLNLPLVHQEHRKLAGRLIGECGQGRKVVFLESSEGGPDVYDEEPGDKYPTGFEAFTVWPLGVILWHFLAVGIAFLFARLMIFGRPQELPPEEISDFGRHVQSFGELLASTGDETFARKQLAQYHEQVPYGSACGTAK